MSADDTFDLRWIFAVLRRWAWLIVGCTVLAPVLIFAGTSRTPPTYSATTTLMVLPTGTGEQGNLNDLAAGERLAFTYSRMLMDWSTLQAVISRLGLNEKTDDLAKRVSAEPIKDTQLIHLTVTDSSPSQAALLADTIAETLTSRLRSLQGEHQTNSLSSMQGKMDALQTLINDTQSKADSVATQKTEDEGQLTGLTAILPEYRTDRRALRLTEQALQLVISQVTDTVRIVRNAHLTAESSESPYTATATLILDQPQVVMSGESSAALGSERLVATFAQMVSSQTALQIAAATLKTGESPESLAQRITVESAFDTRQITISVADTEAERALRSADSMAQAFVAKGQELLAGPYTDRLAKIQGQIAGLSDLIDETQAQTEALTTAKLRGETELARLQTLLAEYHSDYRGLQQNYEQLRSSAIAAADMVFISERAHVPLDPVGGRMLYLLMGVAAGMMAGLGIAFLAEHLDETLKTPEDVDRELGIGTLGTIGEFASAAEELVLTAQPHSASSEAFRMLAASIRLGQTTKPRRTILVTSPSSGEGKSIVAANLAGAMARAGLRVVAVDGDLRLPQLHQLFGLDRDKGLTDSLAHGTMNSSLQPTQIQGLKVLTSGDLPADPVQVISSPGMSELLAKLGQVADIVIIDSPPVLAAADAKILAAAVDGVLLVLRAGHTEAGAAREAVETLRQAGAQVIGAVLNDLGRNSGSYYNYHQEGSKSMAKARLRTILSDARSLKARRAGAPSLVRLPHHGGTANESAIRKGSLSWLSARFSLK